MKRCGGFLGSDGSKFRDVLEWWLGRMEYLRIVGEHGGKSPPRGNPPPLVFPQP